MALKFYRYGSSMQISKCLKIAAVAAPVAATLPGCAQTPQEPQEVDADWRSRIAKYGESNLVNARSLVTKFCLRGGHFDTSPETSAGPFGFTRVDVLGLKRDDTTRVFINDIATGEDGWWRITFNVGQDVSHAFFINPRTRTASCGAVGLTNLRASFRPDSAALQGDELATQVYGLRRDGFVKDVSDQPDDVVCGLAVLRPHGIWETNSGYRPYVEEAQKRGYTPKSCAALTTATSS